MASKRRLTGKLRRATGLDREVRGFLAAIGCRVRELQKQRRATGTELARAIGISQAQVSRLESGLQGFRSEVLVRLAHALKVKPRDLLPE